MALPLPHCTGDRQGSEKLTTFPIYSTSLTRAGDKRRGLLSPSPSGRGQWSAAPSPPVEGPDDSANVDGATLRTRGRQACAGRGWRWGQERPSPRWCFWAESTVGHPPRAGTGGASPHAPDTSPINTHWRISEVASLLFLLWTQESSDEISPSPNKGVLYVSRRERKSTSQPTERSLMFHSPG